MEKKNNVNKTQYAYGFLRARIVSGEYGPGYRIVIDQVAKELKLSTIPVREAIRQLESEGLIQFKPYSGAIVQLINEKEYLDTMFVLAILEGYATAQAAKSITNETILELEAIVNEGTAALYNFELEKFDECNRKFHEAIFEHCENPYLIDSIRQGWQRLERYRMSVFTLVPQRTRESFKEHMNIVELLKARVDPSEIEKMVRQHRMNTVKAIQSRNEAKKNKA
ncbi:MAG: GntR family transcriptional regulator [Firmicutes bacterium]|nr:GntR family transcriptional regulator [Bacillota bacterium]